MEGEEGEAEIVSGTRREERMVGSRESREERVVWVRLELGTDDTIQREAICW